MKRLETRGSERERERENARASLVRSSARRVRRREARTGPRSRRRKPDTRVGFLENAREYIWVTDVPLVNSSRESCVLRRTTVRTHVCVKDVMELLEYVKRVLESVIIQSADVTRVSDGTAVDRRTDASNGDDTATRRSRHGGGGYELRGVRHRTVLAGEEIEDMRHAGGLSITR